MLLAFVLVNSVFYAITPAALMWAQAGSKSAGNILNVTVAGAPLVLSFNGLTMLYFGYEWATDERGAPPFVLAAVVFGLAALSSSWHNKKPS
ncbi:hypothetical protein [Streptomyces sp. NPDC005538]|uniref:hypothetical protein n=1 Tax=Streptomyces sp. NPDC005538 TaxID=3157043 RepID=UPI0033BA3C37